MRDKDTHLSDEELVLAADGELAATRANAIREHLAACWVCRARQHELEGAVAAVVRLHREQMDTLLPPADAARARLRAELAGVASAHPTEKQGLHPVWGAMRGWQTAAAGALLLVVAVGLVGVYQQKWAGRNRPVYVPSPVLTPGAARVVDREQLCRSPLPKNQLVPADMRRRVFDVYGISNADPRAYEVDYLITPALGGADDIRNLWPQSYRSTVWNAQVKDALEDRLHDLVCQGQLDLTEAQRDISTDWIAAYKKYFQTT